MALKQELEKQGSWLFRWRSYLPIVILPIMLVALRNSEYLERALGDFADEVWEGFCIALSFAGLAIRCIVVGYAPKGTSGRNAKEQKATTLNTTGMYSIVRHPLYLGNFVIALGITLFIQVWWFALIAILAFWLYYERIMFAEEEFLEKKFGTMFSEWADKTPTLLPKWKHWQRPGLPFSFKNVLRREYSGFFAIIASFTFLEIIGDALAEGRLELNWKWWVTFFITGLIVYLTLRTLKRRTGMLDVGGR
jgi:protein-S-isoprenylcysteine O-methyltransferase Ste14